MKVLTFDLEEWFHILDNKSTKTESEWAGFEARIHRNVERILGLLEQNNQKATFFCLGWIARKYPEVIRNISGLGHEIGCHSDQHQLVFEMTPEAFRKDTKTAIESLQDIIGKKVISYRAPGFSITPLTNWAFDILMENGIERDSSIFPAKRAHGGYPSFGAAEPALIRMNGQAIKEFPINLGKFLGKQFVYSGGGYFRVLPYMLIDHLSRHDKYIMTYFHPRDFDPDQPKIKELSLQRTFKSYAGLRSSSSKFKIWIENYKFVDLDTADKGVEWKNAKVINL